MINKVLLGSAGLIIILMLSGCVSQSKYEELQFELEAAETTIQDMQYTINNCNSQIEDAQSYAGESYEDMEYALYNLDGCYY